MLLRKVKPYCITAAITEPPRRVTRLEFHRRCFSAVVYDFILDLLSLLERAHSTTLDSENVHKHVLAAASRLNEPIAFGWIEPFDGAVGHSRSPNRRSTMSSSAAPTVILQAQDGRCGRQLGSSRIRKMASADLSVLDLDQTSGLPLQKRLRGGKGNGRSGSS